MIRIDLAMAFRRSLSIASASSNFSNGIGLLYSEFSEPELSRLYSSQRNRAKEQARRAELPINLRPGLTPLLSRGKVEPALKGRTRILKLKTAAGARRQ